MNMKLERRVVGDDFEIEEELKNELKLVEKREVDAQV